MGEGPDPVETRGRVATPVARAGSAAVTTTAASPADRALTGAPAARRLVREVTADPGQPRRIVVVGPGGAGKTVLLGILTGLYQDAGLRTVTDPADGPVDPDAVLIVDDAHTLDAAALDRLGRWSASPATRIVLAHRPWPRDPAFAVILPQVEADRPAVVLGPLSRTGIAERAALLLGERPPAELVDLVQEQSGGSPALVDRLLAGLRGDGAVGTAGGEPPASVIRWLGHDLDAQPAPVGRFLLARAVGAPIDPEVLGPLLDVPADTVTDLVEHAVAAGLLLADGAMVPLVRQAVLRTAPLTRRLVVRRRLAEIRLELGGDLLTAARGLLGTGVTGSRVAGVLERAGDEALGQCLPVAADLFDAAVEAGAPALRLADRRAEAALLAGDLDTALARADQVLAARPGTGSAQVDTERLTRAGTVAAAALAQRGMLGRAAELYRWLARLPGAAPALPAVPALIGTGALAEAREILAAEPAGADRPPTLLAGAEDLLARGVHDAVVGSPTAALSQLTRAAVLLEQSGRAALMADTPAALAALVAVHCGELEVAQSVLERAVATGLGEPVTAARHRLLQAWIAMHRGAVVQARALLVAAEACTPRFEPRDELVAAALEVALARRTGDLAALLTVWGRAREAVVRHPVDLFCLQPLGELAVGAARLQEESWVAPYLDEAHALLDRLGKPALWSAPLHWAGLQAAIAAGSADGVQRHAAALDGMVGAGRYAAAMAAAGRQWLRVLAGDVDAGAVEATARGLHAVGLSWEGGRLAGQAAIRTRDRKDMAALLGCARALQSAPGTAAPAAAAPGTARPAAVMEPIADPGHDAPATPADPPAAVDASPGSISDREREVAELVLAGLTYKQIGEQLFISAKTVEHHVARMRQRLGSGSRGELFAHLRMLVNGRAG